MFVDSIKDFKDKYNLIHPESESAYNFVLRLVTDTDKDGRTIIKEDGQVKTRLVSLFPFRWWRAHLFYNQDKAAHVALYRYVESFILAQWMTKTWESVVNDKSEFV